MIFDIFSSFDPWTTYFGNNTIILASIGLFPPILIIAYYSSVPAALFLTWPFSLECQQSESTTQSLNGLPSIYIAVGGYIILLNWIGLIPYFCAATSHLIITITLGLPCWLSSILSSITHNTSNIVSTFLPSGAPSWLNPFLLIIEITSTVVRPITLSFRLAANISTGHVIIIILGIYISYYVINSQLLLILLTISLKSGYFLFEVAVGGLQAYIFTLLLTLYTNEHS